MDLVLKNCKLVDEIGEYYIKFSAKHVADKDVEPAEIIIYMIAVYE